MHSACKNEDRAGAELNWPVHDCELVDIVHDVKNVGSRFSHPDHSHRLCHAEAMCKLERCFPN